LGMRAVDQGVHVHDIHASILHALGLNHVNLTYTHNGCVPSVLPSWRENR
jgi:hypothetical protein